MDDLHSADSTFIFTVFKAFYSNFAKMLARTLLSKHSSFHWHIYLDVNIFAYSYFRAADKPSFHYLLSFLQLDYNF